MLQVGLGQTAKGRGRDGAAESHVRNRGAPLPAAAMAAGWDGEGAGSAP